MASGTGGRPEVSDTLRILLPIASKWMIIGTLLEVPEDVLTNIRIKEREDPQECLRAMLAKWGALIDSTPSWGGLAEAMEHVSPAKAKEIREKYLSGGSGGGERWTSSSPAVAATRERGLGCGPYQI